MSSVFPGKRIAGEPATRSLREGEAYEYHGLTKRELFAAMAMQGFLACPDETVQIIKQSVIFADALLEELSRTRDGGMG